MPYEQKDNSGSIFINRGTKEHPLKENSPAMTGTAMVGGTMYRVAAWKKESEKAGKWLSFAFTPVEAQPDRSVPTDNEPKIEEDLPF